MNYGFLVVAAALIGLIPAEAQQNDGAGAAPAEPKVSQLIVYGDDPCPKSKSDEIVVCARMPEEERYRIPEPLREDPNDAENRSWGSRATELQYVGRTGTGSCSPVGAGGMTGCFEELVRAAREEQVQIRSARWKQLVEEARKERLGEIDAEAEAAEREIE